MSRRVRFYDLGGPEVLQVEDYEPAQPGNGEIRIDVKALGINRSEAMFRAGTYTPPTLPSRIGYEAAGIIDEVGPGVSALQRGDVVSVIPVAGGIGAYGTYGDRATVPAYNLVKHPQSLSFVEAAAVWMHYIAAYGMLVDVGKVTKGDTVLINAASSGVGAALIQVAHLLGATTIAATRTNTKAEALIRIGADHVITTQNADVAGALARITKGHGVRLVLDPVGGPVVASLIESMCVGGCLIFYGLLHDGPMTFPPRTFLSNALTLTTFRIGDLTVVPERLERAKHFITEGLASGALHPVIAKTFSLDNIVEAHRYMEANSHVGKIVVVP